MQDYSIDKAKADSSSITRNATGVNNAQEPIMVLLEGAFTQILHAQNNNAKQILAKTDINNMVATELDIEGGKYNVIRQQPSQAEGQVIFNITNISAQIEIGTEFLGNGNTYNAIQTAVGQSLKYGDISRDFVITTIQTFATTNTASSLVERDASGNFSAGTITAAALTVDTSTLYVDATNDRVGIGTTSPSFPLSFGTALGNKIGLYDGGSGAGYGFGIQSNLLQIYCNTSSDRVGVGYGNSSSFTETLTVKAGNVGIGTTSPATRLEVAASTSAFGVKLPSIVEVVNVVASAPTATTNFYINNGDVQYYTSNNSTKPGTSL